MKLPSNGTWYVDPENNIVEVRGTTMVRIGNQIGWVPGIEFVDLHGKTGNRDYVLDAATFLTTYKEWEMPT